MGANKVAAVSAKQNNGCWQMVTTFLYGVVSRVWERGKFREKEVLFWQNSARYGKNTAQLVLDIARKE